MIFKIEFSKYFCNLNQFSLYNTIINNIFSLKCFNFVFKIFNLKKKKIRKSGENSFGNNKMGTQFPPPYYKRNLPGR